MAGLPCFGFVACLTEPGIVRRTIAKRKRRTLSFPDCNGFDGTRPEQELRQSLNTATQPCSVGAFVFC